MEVEMIKTTLTGAIPVLGFCLGIAYAPNLIIGAMVIVAVLGLCFVVGTMIRDEVIR
jgi:gamma-glutamyl-gamma-aminobutyrate hydrolase PuuD